MWRHGGEGPNVQQTWERDWQWPRLSRCVAGPHGKVTRRWKRESGHDGKTRENWSHRRVLPETSMSFRDHGCNTNWHWQIGAENKFNERLLGSSRYYWEDWIARLKNWGAETDHRCSLLRPDNEAITVPTGNQEILQPEAQLWPALDLG